MSQSLSEQANNATIAQVKADRPSQFTIGGSFDGQIVNGGITFDRTWKNGWGATAYLRAWYHDAAVIPTDRAGVVAGGELVKKF